MKYLPIAILIAAYVLLAAIYSFVVPLGEGPDEPGHAAYVFFLAREGRLPDQRQNEVPGEGHQPPLFYALAAPATLWLTPAERQLDLPGNPRFVWAGGDQINAAAHGTRELWPWRGTVLAWHLMRLASVACGAVAVGMTWLAASALQIGTEKTAMPLLAAALVAFNPQFLFIGGLVSNDALLAALGATALWLCVRGQRSGSRGQELALGILLGLALLTKQSALVLVPIIMLTCLGWQIKQHGWRWRRLLTWSSCHLVIITAALVSGWWYWRNWQLYGDLFGLAEFQSQFGTQPFDFTSLAAWLTALRQLHDSFWVRFGWMNVAPPTWVLWIYTALGLLAMVGWAYGLRLTQQKAWHSAIPPLTLAATTFVFVVAFAYTAGLVAWQGRLLFPAISAIAILIAQGIQRLSFSLQHWSKQHRIPATLATCLIAFSLCAVAFWLPFGVIRPAYPVQVLAEQAARDWQGTRVYGRFGQPSGPGAELRAYRFVSTAQPGESLELALLWHAQGSQSRNWSVFVHVVDRQGMIVAQSNQPPRNDAYPLGMWAAGDWVEDAHTLLLPAELPAGSYVLRVGLFDQQGTLERAGVWNAAGELVGDYVELGLTEVTR
ncbi:MAG: glycosyltransferase family 39 protein [Roseiflexaceae bacterium]|nr:glycosyltransferase family 39 protein [Roseiflexaceae bacterium]